MISHSHYQRLYPLISHSTSIFLWFSYWKIPSYPRDSRVIPGPLGPGAVGDLLPAQGHADHQRHDGLRALPGATDDGSWSEASESLVVDSWWLTMVNSGYIVDI